MNSRTNRAAIIVAGGSGQRMGSDLPKQFILLDGTPLLMYTIKQFYLADNEIELILALPAHEFERWNQYCIKYNFTIPHRMVSGGETRFHTVGNALKSINKSGVVAVHDGVRPFVSTDVIVRCFEHAEKTGTAIPVIEPFDSLRQVDESGSKAVQRSNFRLVQTPQVFDCNLLKSAYTQEYTEQFTDDASVVEAYGHKIELIDGNRENIKITTPFDLIVAEAMLKTKNVL